MANSPAELLEFWFAGDRSVPRKTWFEVDEAFDADVRRRFLGLYEDAAKGELRLWRDEPDACLALVILLDQVPRNLFRGTARAFATDPEALTTARHALARGFDRGRTVPERMFFYLPFEHAEDLDTQEDSLRLFRDLGDENLLHWAERHHRVIALFGRFPHRNVALGRETTPDEAEWLEQWPEGF